MKKILVGSCITEKCMSRLRSFGYDVCLLPPFKRFEKTVACHADMLMFFDGKNIITHSEYYECNKNVFDGLKAEVLLSTEAVSDKYPYDILFNAVKVDGVLFSKTEYTSKIIKNTSAEFVNVNQGYTACSTCRVNEKAFITSDKGLYKAYTSYGIDTLLIRSGSIALEGYGYGFIGGASLVFDDAVAFFGKAEEHPDFDKINDFIVKHGKKAISLSDEKLYDAGGAFVFENEQ